MKHRILSKGPLETTTYSEQNGKAVIGHHTDLDPHIKRVRYLRDIASYATRESNPNGWRHVGTVPIPIITDWCRANNYTFGQWARNEDKSKEKFMKYFLSRDFSKLHNEHSTTKRESSMVSVPKDIESNAWDLTGIGK